MDVYEIRTNTKELLYKGEDYTLAVQSYYDFQEEAENDINSNLFGLEIIGYINGMKDKGLYEKGGKLTSGPIYKKGEAVTHDGKVYRVISVLRDSDNYFHYRISSDKTDMLVIKESELKSAKEHHESKIRSSANDMSKLLVVDKYAKTEADSLREDDMYEDDKKASIYVKEIESFINRNNYPKRMSMSSFKELEKYNNHLLNNALALLGRYGPEMANTYKDAYKESKNMYLNPKIITSGNKEKTYKEKIAILEMLQKDMKKDLSSTPKDLLKMEIRIEMLKEKSSEKFSKGGVLGYTLDINKIILNDKDRAIEIEQDALLRGIDVRRSGKIVTIRDFDKIDEVIALLKHNLSFAYPQTKLTFKKGGEISGRYSSVHDFVSRNKLEKEAENIFGKDWEPDDDMQQIRYLAGKNYGVEEIDYETLRDMRSDDYISVYRYDKGGEIDYFEQYELLQKDYPEIYNTVIEHGELTEYNDTERLLNKLNSKGWTFDYGLDNSPFNLRPFAPKMNWPNYEKGGALSKPGVFMVSGYWKDDKSEFNDYLISEYDDVPKGYDDDDIFYYGLSETNLKNSSENDGMEFVITEYRRLENYSQGGALSKEFKFDKNFVVYVPSTSDVSDKISPKELDDRVNEVKQYVANTFGGYTETETEGGYKSSKGDIVEEDVVKVSVFSKNKDWKDKEYEVVKKAKEWAREWGQEAIGFEYEGDLYYIDGEGKMEKGGIFGFGGTIDMPRGSGWGKYKKGERVLKIKDLKEGSNYLAYSDQFNAKNIVYIIPEGKSYLNESGSSMFTDKKVFAYVQPESLKKARSQSDVPLLISEDQLQDNYANYNFYEMKEKEETRRPIRIKRGRDHRGGLRKTYGFGKGGAIYKHAADIGVQYANEKSKDGELETPGMGGYDEAIMESQTDKAANTIVDAIPIAAPFKALGEAGSKAIIGDSKGDERKKKQVIAAGIFAPHKLFAMRKARDKARAEENQYKKGGLTPAKAKKILADGEANGKPLTDKQKRYFGYIAGGGKSYAEGGEIEGIIKLDRRNEEWYNGTFGENGKITWEIPNSDSYIIVQSMDANWNNSPNIKRQKGEGAKAIDYLFKKYPKITSILYDDESEGFWEAIGGNVDTLTKESFYRYYQDKKGGGEIKELDDKGVVWDNVVEFAFKKLNNNFVKNGYEEPKTSSTNRIFSSVAKNLSKKNPFTNPNGATISTDVLKKAYYDDIKQTLIRQNKYQEDNVQNFWRNFAVNSDELKQYIGGSTYAEGGLLNKSEESDFNKWIEDGNAFEQSDNVWVEQTTQYRKQFTLDELKTFFKKEFRSYAEGGEVKETSLQFKKRSEKDSVRIYNAWKKVLDSDFGDKEYQRFEKLVKDTQIPQDSVEKITNYTSTTPRGKQRLIDIYQYWGKESSAYAEGGEIEIGDRVKVIDQDITGTIIRKDGVKNVLLDDDTSWAEEGEEATLIYKDYELEKYGLGGFLTGAVLGAVGGVYVTNKTSKTTKKREAEGKKAKAPKYLYQHPLWDNTIYKYLKEKKTSNKEIDKLWNKGLQNLPEYLKKRNKLKQSIK
jgi:hypothetical protein